MASSPENLGWLQKTLGLSLTQIEGLLFASHWADHLWAIKLYGYPKDNVFFGPLHVRLQSKTYLLFIIEFLEDSTAPDEATLKALHHFVLTLPEPDV